MKRTLSTIVFLAVLGLGSSLSAYVTMGVKWSDSDLPVGIYISQTLSNELADQVAVDAIWASFMTWQNVDCSYVQFVNKGRTTSTSWGISDGKNVISWRESNWPDSKYALAVTSVLGSQYSGGNIFDADMIFNGVNFSWAVDGNKNKVDLISVATHEAGHLIGLDHSPIYSATMYASTSEGMTHQRTLHDDDIAGVCSIYPIDSAPNLPPKEEPKPLNPGDTCSFTFECGSLSCINDGKEKYCASGCQSDSDCGQGFTCIGATQGSICVKTTNLGPTPTQGLGDSCSSQLLCLSSMVCIGDNGANYCTQNCSSATCPSGYSCVPAGTTQVCVKSAAPVEPTKKIGDNCSDNS
ncbi:MAG: matrixin family metalloprotease, partial [Myxococcales bacterium]|nr:matrixin family metalloprotease [Myxococcales bacterium]